MSNYKFGFAAALLLQTQIAQAALPEPSTLHSLETMSNFIVTPDAPSSPRAEGTECTLTPADLPYTDDDYVLLDAFFARYESWLKQEHRDTPAEVIDFFGGRERTAQDEKAYDALLSLDILHERYTPGTNGSGDILKNDSANIINLYLNHANALKYMLDAYELFTADEKTNKPEINSFAISKLRAAFSQQSYAKNFAEGMLALIEDRAAYTSAACDAKNAAPVLAPQ